MSVPKCNQRAVIKYTKTHYYSLKILTPIVRKADIEQYAKKHGESINGLVNRLLMQELGMSESEWKARPEPEPTAPQPIQPDNIL